MFRFSERATRQIKVEQNILDHPNEYAFIIFLLQKKSILVFKFCFSDTARVERRWMH